MANKIAEIPGLLPPPPMPAPGQDVAPPTPVEAPALKPEPAAPAPVAPEIPKPPKPSASIGSHPMVISTAEGLLLVPQEEAIVLLNKVLKLKYTMIIMYTNYGDRLLAHFRDSVADHFEDHSKDERKNAYAIARKITAWGGMPVPAISKVPDISELHQMIMQIMTTESELMEAERAVLKITGDNVALRVFVEELVVTDNHHLDDMRRLLLCEA